MQNDSSSQQATRRRVLASIGAALAASCPVSKGFAAPPAPPKTPHVVFVCGDHEYSGEFTMPILAAELKKNYGMRCTVLKSSPDQNAETNIPELEELSTADLGVFFLRWRKLPLEQLNHISAYLNSGKPMMGFRTSSHSFNYPKGDPLQEWNRFGSIAFGTPPGWGGDGHTHFGHESSTDVAIIPGQESHPVLNGVAKEWHVRSWLYRVLPKWPPEDAVKLLKGKAIKPNKPAEDNPVAWTWKNSFGGRTFFTTLGHPEDFQVESMTRMTVNAIHWTLGMDVPKRLKNPIAINVPYRGMVNSAPAPAAK